MHTPDSTFETHRPRLFAIAYRMLGTRADAEDAVQDAWLRWHGSERDSIRDPESWLVAATTRLGIDRLRAAKTSREAYVGPWLPEPATIEDVPAPDRHAETAEQVSLAFLAVLERLGPEERAAFLLKDTFGYDHARIAELLGHSEANSRQLVHRARARLRAGRPRFQVEPGRHRALLERFMHAARSGDRESIMALLHADARLLSDGGGKVAAILKPLQGAERIARLYHAVALRAPAGQQWRIGSANGEPAILRFREGHLVQVTTLVSDGERILEVLNQMNPDKLRLS